MQWSCWINSRRNWQVLGTASPCTGSSQKNRTAWNCPPLFPGNGPPASSVSRCFIMNMIRCSAAWACRFYLWTHRSPAWKNLCRQIFCVWTISPVSVPSWAKWPEEGRPGSDSSGKPCTVCPSSSGIWPTGTPCTWPGLAVRRNTASYGIKKESTIRLLKSIRNIWQKAFSGFRSYRRYSYAPTTLWRWTLCRCWKNPDIPFRRMYGCADLTIRRNPRL